MKIGMNFPAWDTIGNAAAFAQRLRCLRDLRINSIRLDLHMANINTAEGVYNIYELDLMMAAFKAAGIEVLPYFVGSPTWNRPDGTNTDTYPPTDLTKWCVSVAYLMDRYPEVNYCEIWNEENTSGFWLPTPSVTGYIAMVQAIRENFAADDALKTKKIVMGGAAYLGQIDGTGVNIFSAIHAITPLQNLFDVVCYHPYTDPYQVQSDGERAILSQCTYQNSWLHNLGLEVWANEVGKSTYPTTMQEVFQPHISEEQHAAYWHTVIPELENADFDRVYAFRLDDRAVWSNTDRDAYYGFLRLNGSQKPAYQELKKYCRKNPENLI